jgi:hypothetical protein
MGRRHRVISPRSAGGGFGAGAVRHLMVGSVVVGHGQRVSHLTGEAMTLTERFQADYR